MLNPYNFRRILAHICVGILLSIVTWQWGQAAIIYGKAYLAKWLISHAWQKTLATGVKVKPWPWADTWPVGKMVFSEQKIFYILAGGSGNSLAFGPGHLSNTALPGKSGSSVIGGHRDTHFSFLKNVRDRDMLHIQTMDGKWQQYSADKSWIANSKTEPLTINQRENAIYLVTCYPFNSISHTSEMRFIVKAKITPSLRYDHRVK